MTVENTNKHDVPRHLSEDEMANRTDLKAYQGKFDSKKEDKDGKEYLQGTKDEKEGTYYEDKDGNQYEWDPDSEDYKYTGYTKGYMEYDADGLDYGGADEKGYVLNDDGSWDDPNGNEDPNYESATYRGGDDSGGSGDGSGEEKNDP